jgi:hypothetical protein
VHFPHHSIAKEFFGIAGIAQRLNHWTSLILPDKFLRASPATIAMKAVLTYDAGQELATATPKIGTPQKEQIVELILLLLQLLF